MSAPVVKVTAPPRRLRWSLSTRIFVAFAFVVACSGVASFYAVAVVATLRHELGFLRQRALPLLEELRLSGLELRGFDEALQRAAPHDLEWVVRFVPNARPYQRLDQILAHTRALRDFSQPPRLALLLQSKALPLPALDAHLATARAATSARDDMLRNTELLNVVSTLPDAHNDAQAFDLLVGALQHAIAEKRLADAARLVVEIRRMIRHVHGELAEAERDFERALNTRFEEAERNEANLWLLVISASATALAVSIAMLLAMLATVRPLTVLTDVVRRFAGGDRQARSQTGGASEISTLSIEWNRMADALASRETQLGAQREELARSERLGALGHMAARMVHEVRNPLSSIGLNAELLDEELSREALDPAEARELIAAISREVEHLRVITEGYLDRARPAPAQVARVDLAQWVGALLDFIRSELDRRGVKPHFTAEKPVFVEVDEGSLRQALWNLVRNACEALPNGGDLWLDVRTARRTDAAVCALITVEDSGPGVSVAVQQTLFQPFTTTKERGTGIGLALAQEVALAHHGEIVLIAGEHGTGACFQLSLPAA